jgi:hypothetical protein
MDFVRSWDEWVPEDRVLPPTEENYAQQQKLRELANPIPTPAPKKKGAAPDGKKAVSGAGGDSAPKGVKRSRDHDIEKVINPAVKPPFASSFYLAKRLPKPTRDQAHHPRYLKEHSSR